jgi:hypothetical protein
MGQPKYPEITVELVGQDGNAFHVLGLVIRAMRAAGLAEAEIAAFRQEATSGSYGELLRTCMRWVDVA